METLIRNAVSQLIRGDGFVANWSMVSEAQKKERRAKYMGNIFTILGLIILAAAVIYGIFGLVGTLTTNYLCDKVCTNDENCVKFFCMSSGHIILQGMISCAIFVLIFVIPALLCAAYFYIYAINTIANVMIVDPLLPTDGHIVPENVEILFQNTNVGTRERIIVFADKKAGGTLFITFLISFSIYMVFFANEYYYTAVIWFIIGPPIIDIIHSFLFGKWVNEV